MRIASEVVDLLKAKANANAKGARWKTAHVEVQFRAQRIGVHSGHGDQVTYAVVLTRADGGKDEVPVASYSFRYLGTSPESEREPTLRASFRLSVAPDGHALAVTNTKTAGWQYVALDAPTPFACNKTPFPAGASGDGWQGSKDTRTLLIESLGAPNGSCPVPKATLYACEHTDDGALWGALASSSIHSTFEIFHNRLDEERQRVLRCAQEAARRHPSVRQAAPWPGSNGPCSTRTATSLRRATARTRA